MKMLSPLKSSHRRQGFTLMELILTIAILAVLVTLSISAAQSIRAKSDDMGCITNLRNSGQAILTYISDQNGAFFPRKYWFQYSSTRNSTNKGMREYFGVDPDLPLTDARLRVDTMLTCPAMMRRYPTLKDDAFRRGYGVNYFLMQTVDDKSGAWQPTASFKNIRNVPKLSAMWMIADGALGAPLGAANPTPREALGSINDNTAYHATEFVAYPHSGKKNHFFFLDGHIAGLNKRELVNVPSRREFWGSKDMTD